MLKAIAQDPRGIGQLFYDRIWEIVDTRTDQVLGTVRQLNFIFEKNTMIYRWYLADNQYDSFLETKSFDPGDIDALRVFLLKAIK